MLFPILKVHSLPKLRDFLDCVFPLVLYFISHGFKYAPWQIRRIVQILRSTCFKILRTQNFRVIFFFWDLCFKLGNSKIFGWNGIVYTLFLLWFLCFCLGSATFSELHFCLHCLNFFLVGKPYRPLQYSLSGHFSEDWFPEGSLFVWTLWYLNCKGIFLDFFLLPYRSQWCWPKGLCKCLFPWVCHARWFCVSKLQEVFLCDIYVQIHSIRF